MLQHLFHYPHLSVRFFCLVIDPIGNLQGGGQIARQPRLLQSSHPGGCPVGMCDGSARMVYEALTPTTWHAALTPNGGEVLGSDW